MELAGVPDAPGVVSADDPAVVFAEIHAALGAHRALERFDPTTPATR